MSSVYTIDPLKDRRWPELVNRHPDASVFHTQGWLNALKATYQYEPIAFTTSAPGADLRNGIVVCAIRSWLTGRRLVSLPFSDHCHPLIDSANDLRDLLRFADGLRKREHWKYVELRPIHEFPLVEEMSGMFPESERYALHLLSLVPELNELQRSFHKDCVQRKVRRAERECLEYETGRTELQLQKLYSLLKLTRHRHRVPPQPVEWFRNVMKFAGDSARIHIASKDGLPVAGIFTLSQGRKVVYKYGGSDARRNNLGGMPLLFWKSIQSAKESGAIEFDFGRSDLGNPGLIAFKDHWATRSLVLTYRRCQEMETTAKAAIWKTEIPRRTFASLPAAMQASIGKHLYRHIG
jgi:hypothetical protein